MSLLRGEADPKRAAARTAKKIAKSMAVLCYPKGPFDASNRIDKNRPGSDAARKSPDEGLSCHVKTGRSRVKSPYVGKGLSGIKIGLIIAFSRGGTSYRFGEQHEEFRSGRIFSWIPTGAIRSRDIDDGHGQGCVYDFCYPGRPKFNPMAKRG
jgi:hypothetical protein